MVDAIKQHAVLLSIRSPRAEHRILTEYLWAEQGAETAALHRVGEGAPEWLGKLVTHHLNDERRHATLLKERLQQLDASSTLTEPPALARAKLLWLERACAPYGAAFSAGSIVVVLAVAAQLEATGVRVFGRHLTVLERWEATNDTLVPTTVIVRSILADERRHARSCAAACERLVADSECASLAALRERVETIDRAFGVAIAVHHWLGVARRALRDRVGG